MTACAISARSPRFLFINILKPGLIFAGSAISTRTISRIRLQRPRFIVGFSFSWRRYGFVNAFNPLTSWYDNDVIGIDTGITLLMAENLRTGFVWNTFMKNKAAQRGMRRAGFKKYHV